MADRRLVLSEPLCFIVSRPKLGKIERKAIKSVALDFYRSEDIADAKNKLLSDVSLLQLGDCLLAWFGSYLSNRQQRVRANQSLSSWRELKAGMPQGSWLGPVTKRRTAN